MLCQRVKKELFETEAEYLAALAAHHAVLAAAVKTKQVVDVAACDALDGAIEEVGKICLLYTSPSPRDQRGSRMPSSA